MNSLRFVLLAAVFATACSSSGSDPAISGQDALAPPISESEDAGSGSDASKPDGSTKPETKLSSGGSGGVTCTKEEDLVDGRKACVAKLGSVEVKIAQPAAGSGPLRLGLYVHGDGAGAHKSRSALKAMVPWLDSKHGLGVSVLAPNGCAWWQTPSYDCSESENAPDVTALNSKALEEALEQLYKAFDIRLDGVAYYGSSGGSIFLSEQWLPLHGDKYYGVFALMCGGRAPAQPFAWDNKDEALVAKMPLFFTYGDKDFLVPEIETAMADFQGKKFSVTKKIIPDAEHCAFNGHGEAVGIWQSSF